MKSIQKYALSEEKGSTETPLPVTVSSEELPTEGLRAEELPAEGLPAEELPAEDPGANEGELEA